MKKRFFIALTAASLIVFAGCNNAGKQRDKAAAKIAAFENAHDPMGIDYARNPASADTLIGLYTDFADTYPDDSLAPLCLQKGANVACLTGSFDKAIELAGRVIDGYSGFEAMDDCMLTQAKAYELSEQPEEAKAAYQRFIDTYPNHPLTEDLKRTITLLDMGAVTPEEQLAAILAEKEQ
ncbi:MAG: tetratricopeptide repeat protein [Bacteroidales bacterium]|jgi:tetratricopeptide (TPR) repeat protein|nr:tetratricopeptide repeat protein [Bacteroidales bacterium]